MSKEMWVKNTGNTAIQVKAVLKAATETTVEVSKDVVFPRYKVDNQTGLVVSNGFTAVEKEVYDALISKKMFKDLVDQQVLVAYDKQPDEAVTPSARIVQLSARVAELEGSVTALTEENDELKKDGGSAASKKKIEDLTAELETANAKIAELEKKIESGEFDQAGA